MADRDSHRAENMSTAKTPSWARTIAAAVICLATLMLTGCVGPAACGPMGCGSGGCGTSGPLALASCGGCGSCDGCGELYIDPWINEPADCHDPCDQCGNHNGQSCGKCRSVFSGFASLWGYRCDAPCGDCGSGSCGGGCAAPILGGCGGCDTGCDSCASSCCGDGGCDSMGCSSCGGSSMHENPIYIGGDSLPPGSYVESDPTPAYQPRRSKQIFTPRGSVADSHGAGTEY